MVSEWIRLVFELMLMLVLYRSWRQTAEAERQALRWRMRADSARDDMDSSDEWASILLVIATRYRVQATGEDPGDARDKIIEEARGE